MQGDEVAGYPAYTTSAAVSKGLVMGDFSDYVIGQWGGLDLVFDTLTLAKDGMVRIVINGYFDAKPRRAGSFKAKILK